MGQRAGYVLDVAKKLVGGEAVRADHREVRQPTLTDDVAHAIALMIDNNVNGVFHAAGATATTKYEWACMIATLLSRSVEGISVDMESQPGPARPVRSWLKTTKLSAAFPGFRATGLIQMNIRDVCPFGLKST